jgi:lipopolysaccharide/colanic/teichoic acid biosynthesis glycosyltransferase
MIRTFDIILSATALLCLLPLFVIVIVVLRFTGEGQVFYRQIRVGRGGKTFELLKFTTMRKNSSSTGSGELTLPGDPRVLPVGRFLRKTKIDELPQLINVLKGELSLIGPRPQTPRYYCCYPPDVQTIISQVRPGLSGVSSVLFRNEESLFAKVADPLRFDKEVIMPYKGELERWFVLNYSVGLYWELIFLTLMVWIFPKSCFHKRLLKRVPPPPPELASLFGWSNAKFDQENSSN